jgi:hypothetical protein
MEVDEEVGDEGVSLLEVEERVPRPVAECYPPRIHEAAVWSLVMSASAPIDHVIPGELPEAGPSGGEH